MLNQLSWKVGGQQGEGIDSTGEIFAIALNRQGYYLYAYRHFSSRIKGGHTNNKIRVSTKPISALSDDLDVLVAFDQDTINVNAHELRAGGIIIADSKFSPKAPTEMDVRLFSVPFTEIAQELGTTLMKNMVAVGASSAALGLPVEMFKEVVTELFTRKGQNVVDRNMEAISKGAEYIYKEAGGSIPDFQLESADGKKRMYMIGNDAIALGLLAGGARFMPAYPITPASEIMEYLIKKLPLFGGAVIQTEDEIAAVTMAIGANYTGARAFTASAGPGLSLMMEAIGLAGMTETPLVIINTQRGGPSTGLPTKQEQSDINAMIYGTHGEIPKVVLAPSTPEEAFYDAIEALNIAEEYQVPVILLTDLQLSLGKQTVEPLQYDKIEIRRGKLNNSDQPETESGMFKRYEFTESGVSPRVIPGVKNGIHHVTGVEHNEVGRPSEDALNRRKMMDKRLRKLDGFTLPTSVVIDEQHEKPDALVVGMGATRGAIEEAAQRLAADGMKINTAIIRLIWPFPERELRSYFENAKRVIVVENNATGQLADLMKLHFSGHEKVKKVLKYDGNPFLPSIVYQECKELL
ncbi:2-oxoglutarate ferredoxin oxidoreductase subunit alpha [Ammoniphilus oxalaticus]|uniref:2-oxoglutarate ferredoxin oxidoreductase subunit alpha n=1 Tax=Ammoniphilus oxalaticus TaxID=66863 RepID=A0A419SJZ7_9BACL|nr:2-oxoacid:acceptor oxidoreductase subunit alpha [Ammoniphilus oxalaticus]RKD24302.1 2-oxoglutarate ferredoxin oxidoreductase subunit alpha [Ammoniphilus oxalaticus]